MRIGVQSYSLRRLSYERALKVVSELGVGYVEAYPGHVPPGGLGLGGLVELHEKLGTKMVAHGVNHMPKDERTLRALFDFATKAGVEVLTADPDLDALELVDDLAKEYGVLVAIHNHGPNHRWGSYKRVFGHVEKLGRVGMCLDLGHLARAGEDPIAAVETLRTKIYDVHVKDVDAHGGDVAAGDGVVGVGGVIEKIRSLGLDVPLMVEYEPNPDNPVDGIARSLEYVKRHVGQ